MTGTASMIASLSGVVAEVADDGGELVLEVGGVGYRVLVTPLALRELDLPPAGPSPGDELRLHIHHVVREDAQVLYGFATSDQRRVFGELIGAHGVGPALALAILSVHTPDELRVVVASGDAASLRGVPGVGGLTAPRRRVQDHPEPRLGLLLADELLESPWPQARERGHRGVVGRVAGDRPLEDRRVLPGAGLRVQELVSGHAQATANRWRAVRRRSEVSPSSGRSDSTVRISSCR